MSRPSYAWIPLLMTCTASLADNCDSVSAAIDAKIRAAGVSNFTLRSIEVDEIASGKVVGSCALGKRKIIYTVAGGPAAAAASPAAAASAAAMAVRKVKRATVSSEIITECKDGSMSLGGECKN